MTLEDRIKATAKNLEGKVQETVAEITKTHAEKSFF